MYPKISIIGGGTATNELVGMFSKLSPQLTYVLPVSDNGGSTSELIRVIGGPAIGDIRSRLTRLIPEEQHDLRNLLSYRLSSDPREAKVQWNEIVDGTHAIWAKIKPSTKEIFRSFFIHVNVELLKRSKHSFSLHNNNKLFRYELANIGNLFLTGVRLFIGSLDSAIELFISLTGITPSTEVLPCINTNFTYHISALLENGLIITGQSQISHPSPDAGVYPPPINQTRRSTPVDVDGQAYFPSVLDNVHLEVPINQVAISKIQHQREPSVELALSESDEETGNIPQYTHPELKKSQLHFSKSDNIEPLLSPIKRIFYISPYGEEIRPTAHNRVVQALTNTEVVVYSIGSLMTSIVPVVILKGIGKAIAQSSAKKRILLLNGCEDRETSGMDAASYVEVIVNSAFYSMGTSTAMPWTHFVTHLVYMEKPNIEVNVELLESKGITCVEVARKPDMDYFDDEDLYQKLRQIIT